MSNRHHWSNDFGTVLADPLKFQANLHVDEDTHIAKKITGLWRAVKPTTDDLPVSSLQPALPLEQLGLQFFDLIAPLVLKIAAIDDEIHAKERIYIQHYFASEWGYDKDFIEGGLSFFEPKVNEHSISDIVEALAAYQDSSPYYDGKSQLQGMDAMLQTIMKADGRIDEREIMAIELVNRIYNEQLGFSIKNIFSSGRTNKKIGTQKELTLVDAYQDVIELRLELASDVELERLRTILNLKADDDIQAIAHRYRCEAGNFVGVGVGKVPGIGYLTNNLRSVDEFSYQDILLEGLEDFRPAGESIQVYVNKLKSLAPWQKNGLGLADQRHETEIIHGLEIIFIEKIQAKEEESSKPMKHHTLRAATIEFILMGRRQSVEQEAASSC